MTRQRLADLGFGIALAGMAITLLALTPLSSPTDVIPWPLLAGSTVYIVGSLMLVTNARGEAGKRALGRLRYVRIGIIVVVVFLVQRMVVR